MKKILFLFALSLMACSGQEEGKEPIPVQEVVVPNYDSLVGKEVLILKVDDWSDWSMWNEERTKVQGHIYAGETSTILEAKEIQGVLRYKVTNSEGQTGLIQADVCRLIEQDPPSAKEAEVKSESEAVVPNDGHLNGKKVLIDEMAIKGFEDNPTYYFESRLFNGVMFNVFPDGHSYWEYSVKNGKLDGLAREWWPNGELRSEKYFKEGKLDGAEKIYGYGTNSISYINYWRNGRMISTTKEPPKQLPAIEELPIEGDI